MIEKNVTGETTKVDDTLKIGVYTIYDTVLKQYDIPIAVPVNKL